MEHKKLDLWSLLGSNHYTHFKNLYFLVTALTPGLLVTRSSHLHYIPPLVRRWVIPVYHVNGGMAEKLQYGNRRFEAFSEVCSLDLKLLSWKSEVVRRGNWVHVWCPCLVWNQLGPEENFYHASQVNACVQKERMGPHVISPLQFGFVLYRMALFRGQLILFDGILIFNTYFSSYLAFVLLHTTHGWWWLNWHNL